MEAGLPKTAMGWLSVALAALFVLVSVAFMRGIVRLGLGTPLMPIVQSAVGMTAGLVGLVAMIVRRERSLMVLVGLVVTLALSLLLIVFLLGYALSGH